MLGGGILYSVTVLPLVAWMGDIGARCIFGTELKEAIPDEYIWTNERPEVGDQLQCIGGRPLNNYTDYIRAMRTEPAASAGRSTSSGVTTPEGRSRRRWRRCGTVRSGPFWSLVWFLQEMVIFAVGARVFWKRPQDDSARLFFWLCIVTVGAYMGGYHWTEIVVEPPLIYLVRGVRGVRAGGEPAFLSGLPARNPVLVRYRRAVLAALYGVPIDLPGGALGQHAAGRGWLGSSRGGRGASEFALRLVTGLALGYIALAVVIFWLCIVCLVVSYRSARTRAERNQVQWILLASLLASLLIAYLLGLVWFDTSTLGPRQCGLADVRGLAPVHPGLRAEHHALQADAGRGDINRSVVYFALSVTAGLIYSGVLRRQRHADRRPVLGRRDIDGAGVAGVTVIVILVLSGGGPGAVPEGDRPAVLPREVQVRPGDAEDAGGGRQPGRSGDARASAAGGGGARSCGWSGGRSIWPRRAGGPLRLVACHGPTPDEQALAADNPLVERLRRIAGDPACPHAMALSTAPTRRPTR